MTNVPPPPPGDVPPPAGNVPPAGSTPPPPPAGSAPYASPPAGSAPYGSPGNSPYAGQGAPGPSPYAAPSGGTSPKQGLSLSSFIVGVAGLVLGTWFIPFLGLLVGIAAVVLGFIAKGKEPGAPSWMWIVGVITGFLTILINLIVTIGFIALIMAASQASQFPTSP